MIYNLPRKRKEKEPSLCWYFNDTLTLPSMLNMSVSFEAGNKLYGRIYCMTGRLIFAPGGGGATTTAYNNGWTSNAYRFVRFIKQPSSKLMDKLLKNNAVNGNTMTQITCVEPKNDGAWDKVGILEWHFYTQLGHDIFNPGDVITLQTSKYVQIRIFLNDELQFTSTEPRSFWEYTVTDKDATIEASFADDGYVVVRINES